ncbi:ABC transporter substrate-binding protein [Desertimonas flava]|uniref:ABC transporter substrate-binding protein n=1 Tax=Desertimonas flava TaxID=2064846 RepID=UPI000E34FE08|nr:ABC transporter substrate-binding protein [Desertimonas flava]
MRRTGTIRARRVAVAGAAVVALGTAGAARATTAPPDASEPAASAAASDCILTEPLRIGYAADFSDFGGFADQPGSEAAGVQVDLLNEAGGVGGLPVEYIVKELPEDPSGAQRAAQEMLDDGVNAIIAPPFAYNGVPLIDTVDGQVPIISNASTDLQLAQPDRGAFLMSFSDPVQAAAAAEFAVGEGATTAVTFSSPDDPYFTNTTAAFAESFGEQGGEVLRDFTFGIADEDFSSQVNELASMDPLPEVLYTAMIMPGAGALLEQIRAAGLDDLQVIGADSFDATVVWSAGEVAEGVSFTAHTFPSDDNGVQAFLDAAADAGVEIETVSFGALASDAVKVFAHAAETACSVEGTALIETIASIADLEVTTGTVTYAGTNGVPEKDVAILTISDGAPALTTALRPAFIPGS